MARGKCNRCNDGVVSAAEDCPRCGAPVADCEGLAGLLIVLLMALVILLIMYGAPFWGTAPPPSPSSSSPPKAKKAAPSPAPVRPRPTQAPLPEPSWLTRAREAAKRRKEYHPRPLSGARKTRPRSLPVVKGGKAVKVDDTVYIVWRSWWAQNLTDPKFVNNPPDDSYLVVSVSVRNDASRPAPVEPFYIVSNWGSAQEQTEKAAAVPGTINERDWVIPGHTIQGMVVFDVPQGTSYRLKVSGSAGETDLIELLPHAAPR